MEIELGQHVLTLISVEEARAYVEKGITCYDNTKLVAINTCPTWGVLRYALHRTESGSGRSMAIDAGKACHDYFAAQRIWHLRDQYKDEPSILTRVGLHATALFGGPRYAEALSANQDAPDPLTNSLAFCLPLLYTSGFYDSPTDRKRTMSNLEQACIAYSSRYLLSEMPVYIDDKTIGVELPFCILFTDTQTKKPSFIYTGRIDGIHNYNNTPHIAENKTASRLDNSWRMMFATSSQVTGYMVAATLMLDKEVRDGFVMGLQIPIPKSYSDGTAWEPVSRNDSDFIRWYEWVLYSIDIYKSFIHRPIEAPRFTHSCNRYFHPCQFIPFCSMSREEQVELIEGMRIDVWSPLDQHGDIADQSEGVV